MSPGEVAFVDAGNADAPPVVLLQGSAGSSSMWDALAPMLSPWMRVITPDLLGEGDVAMADGGVGIEARADSLRELLDELHVTSAAFVGHDEGGAIAQLLALDGRARAMVLIGSVPLGAKQEPRLAALEVPAFVVWGEDDAVVDVAVAERLGDLLSMATVAVLPGCGHSVLQEAPETVAPLIFQWLRSRYLGVEHRHESGPVAVSLGRRPLGEGPEGGAPDPEGW